MTGLSAPRLQGRRKMSHDFWDDEIRNLKERIEALEAALRKICDGPRDADKSYAELFSEVCWEARAALNMEKTND